MQKFDVLIVGGGMVGLTLALAIRKQSELTVAVADTQTPDELTAQPEIRVSAINAASQQIFTRLDVWQDIIGQRAQAYQHMHIWDKAGYGKLDFNLDDVTGSAKPEQLGWIIENKVIRNALWQKAQMDEGISFFTDEAVASIGVGESEVFASFGSSMPITANLLVGADGANSWVRKQVNMPITFRDYDHHALVATVSCEQGYQDTAWQVFLPTGPLAFLPLYEKNLCSIVWSTSPEEAQRLRALDKAAFAKEITAATDGKLGRVSLESELGCYPLMMRLAQDFVKDKVVLIGDAAHTIHPLAGQGVNLGLLDAAALAQTLTGQVTAEQGATVSPDISDNLSNEIILKQFARWRKAEAAEMIAAMEAIKQLFTPQQEVTKLIRGIGMSLLDNFSPAKKHLIRQALGYKGQLPELAKYTG
ncbi:FAD-dependent monooxygenase [Thalassomonas viridans]|uniref:FAD-dependent monooxygenase n=1 Tax=Thalassomonas viridans TaxID=137584 RepID=A0AAE9Z5V5_9GAMM|nr:FAD-dependent monooxygenase [Thalassomonas viridans]WDE06634.1 FAD-dependent monooxygenase [Thalassomonas viridans]